MRSRRMLQLAFVLATAVLVGLGLWYLFTVPLYCGQSSRGPRQCYLISDMSNPVIAEDNQVVLRYIALISVLYVVAIGCGLLYNWTRRKPWRLMFWGVALPCIFLSFLLADGLGFAFIPASLTLLAAAITSHGMRPAT